MEVNAVATGVQNFPNETLNVTEKQQELARKIDAEVFEPARQSDLALHLTSKLGLSIELPHELLGVVLFALSAVRDGRRISIGTVPEEVTTTTAAKMLDISRPSLMKLIKDGTLAAHMVGSHHRLKTADVIKLQKQRRHAQQAAVLEMLDLEDDLEDFS